MTPVHIPLTSETADPAPATAIGAAALTTPVPAPSPGGANAARCALARVVDGGTLSRAEAQQAMGAVMDGEASPAQLGGLLVALRMRGETADELVGFARAMRERMIRVEAPDAAVDTCGTGGDSRGTFNISTAAALVVAAAGVPVAKHGNRAITSSSGSADVLEALGVTVRQSPGEAARALVEDRFAFLFAPDHHPAMRHAGATRRETVRTPISRRVPIASLGLREAAVTELAGGMAQENARLIEDVLRAEHGPRRDVVLLNAGAALVVAGRVRTLAAGVALAASTIDSGAGTDLLLRLRARALAAVAALTSRTG